MKKFTSILLCACLMLNIAIVGVLPVVAVGTSTRVTRTIDFDDTAVFHNEAASGSGYINYYYENGNNALRWGIYGMQSTASGLYATFSSDNAYGGNGQSVKFGRYTDETNTTYKAGELVLRHYNSAQTAIFAAESDYILSFQVYLDNTQRVADGYKDYPNGVIRLNDVKNNAATSETGLQFANGGWVCLRNPDTDSFGSANRLTTITQDAWHKISLVVNKSSKQCLLMVDDVAINANNLYGIDYLADGVWIVHFSGLYYMYIDNIELTTLDLSQDDYGQYFASTVNLDANGGSVSSTSVMTNGHGYLDLDSLPVPTYGTYQFAGWYMDAAFETQVTAATQFTGGETLYAKWVSEITYNSNGGTGEMASHTAVMGESLQLFANDFKKAGYMFTGWSTDKDAIVPEYTNLQEFTPEGSMVLYAVWQDLSQSDYQAKVATGDTVVTVGQPFTVYVQVASKAGSGITAFNAAEIVLDFSNTLTFDSAQQTESIESMNLLSDGKVKIVLTGADKNIQEGTYGRVYTLIFTAKTKTESASVVLSSAAFGTAAGASTENLTPAYCDATAASVKIVNTFYGVSFTNGFFTGAEQVESGEDYTFSINKTGDYAYYTYTPSVTMGGASAYVTNNGDDTYTVQDVSGALVIGGSRAGKTYTVSFTGDTGDADFPVNSTSATYDTLYTFSLPNNVEPQGETNGYTYTATATVGGETVACTRVSSGLTNTYEISGNAIIGNVTVTVTKTTVLATQVTVAVNDETGAVTSYTATAEKGEDQSYTLTLTPNALYDYTVTATMAGTEGTLTVGSGIAQSGNGYTITNITGNIVFTVSATVKITDSTVHEYFSLGDAGVAYKAWLIILPAAQQVEGKYYAYSGVGMHYSTAYNAYCTLVFGDKPVDEDGNLIATNFSIENGSALPVNYGKDVNNTGVIDANDAQFVYNMYIGYYTHADMSLPEITVDKLLRADLDFDYGLDSNDVTIIVNSLLGK